MATTTAKRTTKKVNAKTNNKDLGKSLTKIKDTAKNINKEVVDTAGEVVEDLRSNGEQWREVAVKTVKDTLDKVNQRVTKVTETVTMENVMDTAKNVNKFTLKTAEEIVEGALVNGEKIQGITAKAMKGGLQLAAKQQDIVFDALETVKGQLVGSAVRFRKLFSKN